MRNTTADADQDEGASLYDLIVDATGIEFDEHEFAPPDGVEKYKNHLVRHFGRMDANDFDRLPEDLRDWVNEATGIFNDNRRSKEEPEALPDIEGMPEPVPQKARRARVSVIDDDDEVAPPPPSRRTRVTAAPPVEDEDEDAVVEEEDEPEPPPPPSRSRTRRVAADDADDAPAPKRARTPAAPAARSVKRDPDSGRYAKVMPHYLKKRSIEVPELQERIEKTDGASYSETTLDRALAACRAVVAWSERNGVDFSPALARK
jgi:hypothetical protein